MYERPVNSWVIHEIHFIVIKNSMRMEGKKRYKRNELITVSLDYQGIVQQSRFKKENYTNTTLEIKKLVACNNTISVYFYSSSIDKKTDELKYRRICGIWQLNEDNKIDRVWAVATLTHQSGYVKNDR